MSQLFYNEASYEKDIIVFNGHPVDGLCDRVHAFLFG